MGPSPLTLGHHQFTLESEWTYVPNLKKVCWGVWDTVFTRFRRIARKHNASSHRCRRHRGMRINSNYTNRWIQMLSVIHCSMLIWLYQSDLAVRWSWGSSTMTMFVFGHECVHPRWDVCVCVCVVNIAPLRREWEKQKEAKQSYGGQREEEDWEESGEKKNQQKEQGRGIKQRWRRRVQEQENNQLRRGSGRRRQIRSKVVSEWSEFWPYGNLCDKKKKALHPTNFFSQLHCG